MSILYNLDKLRQRASEAFVVCAQYKAYRDEVTKRILKGKHLKLKK